MTTQWKKGFKQGVTFSVLYEIMEDLDALLRGDLDDTMVTMGEHRMLQESRTLVVSVLRRFETAGKK